MQPRNPRHTYVAPRLRYRLMAFLLGLALLPLPLPPPAAAEPVQLPVEGGVVTSRVGWRPDPFGSARQLYHRGIDIAVPVGTPVKAVRTGRVTLAGPHGAYGIAIILEHGDGSRTLYGHNALANVRPGEVVAAGTMIALSGNSGRSTGPHVHFEELPPTDSTNKPAMEAAITVAAGQLPLGQRAVHEQAIDRALRSVLNSINRPASQPALTGQGG